MSLNAYVQIDTKGGSNKEITCEGLRENGYNVIECPRDIQLGDFSTNNVFYGGVGFIRSISNQYGYNYNVLGDVPDQMLDYAGRKIFEGTLEEALKLSETQDVFIKPTSDKNKMFTGMVLDGSMEQLYITKYMLPPNEKVIISTVVNFLSEWRCLVLDNTILEIKNYKGDENLQPDFHVAEKAVKSWSNQSLKAYACDIGITDTGETLVIECNDLPSLGLYGATPKYFGQMLIQRWREIHQKKGYGYE